MLNTELKNCESIIKLVNSLKSDNVLLKKKIEDDHSHMEELKKKINDLQQQLDSAAYRSADTYITFQKSVVKEMQKHFFGQKFNWVHSWSVFPSRFKGGGER